MDHDDLREAISETSNIIGAAQREETNRHLRNEAAERERVKRLPDCPHCGHKIPKVGVKLCGTCRREVAWVGEEVCENTPTAIAELTRQLAAAEKRRKAEAAERWKAKTEEEAKEERDYIISRSAWDRTSKCVICILVDAAYICLSLYLLNAEAEQDDGQYWLLAFGLAVGFPPAKFWSFYVVRVLAIALLSVLPSRTDDTAIQHSLAGLKVKELKKIRRDLESIEASGCYLSFIGFLLPISLILLPFCISNGFEIKKIFEKYGLDLKSEDDTVKNRFSTLKKSGGYLANQNLKNSLKAVSSNVARE